MLKTTIGEQIWLVEQPDHARVSGYLAAHWGGANGFARPGHFPGAAHPERWREEFVLAAAQHDNGWWEWEAMPGIDPADGLPLGLGDVAQQSPDEGLKRWRLGIPRLTVEHPYAALLTSMHAYWLYAFAFDDLHENQDQFRHPLFGEAQAAIRLVVDHVLTRRFLEEQIRLQTDLVARLEKDEVFDAAVRVPQRYPHFKLLQLFDAMSLLLAFQKQGGQTLDHVPRQSWDDRVTLNWELLDGRTVVCDPYPFDADPLSIHLPVRIIPATDAPGGTPTSRPLTRLHRTPLMTVQFELRSAASGR